jgi:hypothetical protein
LFAVETEKTGEMAVKQPSILRCLALAPQSTSPALKDNMGWSGWEKSNNLTTHET